MKRALISILFAHLSLSAFAESLTLEETWAPQIEVTDHLLVTSNATGSETPRDNILMHEAFVRAEADNYEADIRFTNRLQDGGNRPFVLEKKTLTATYGDWKVQLGDAPHEFGKGIALSLYQDDTFGINHTLEGATLEYRPSGARFIGIAGRVNTLSNPVAVNPVDDPLAGDTLWILGASANIRASKRTKVGGHYLIGLNAPQKEKIRRFDRYWNTVGVTFAQQELFRNVDFYAETNLLLPNRLIDEDFQKEDTGLGTYASLTWAPLPYKVKLEVKDYQNYTFPFRRPPTLEEDIVETDHPETVFGARLYVENRNLAKKVTYYGSYLKGYDRFVSKDIHHGVFGLKFKGVASTSWELNSGYRSLPGYSDLAHGAVKVKVPTFKRQAVELNFQKARLGENFDSIPTLTDRNRFDLSYTFSRSFNTTLGYEFVPSNDAAQGQHFFNFGAELKTGSLTAKAFVGQTSGGTICSSGVCRQVPPYSGALLETIYAF